jgi:hypothetical protein
MGDRIGLNSRKFRYKNSGSVRPNRIYRSAESTFSARLSACAITPEFSPLQHLQIVVTTSFANELHLLRIPGRVVRLRRFRFIECLPVLPPQNLAHDR